MTRDEAYTVLTKYLTNKNLIKHCLACEAVMRALARRFKNPHFAKSAKGFRYTQASRGEHDSGINEDEWGITGLLHDADYELTKGEFEKHGLLLFEHEKNIPREIAHAIKSHNSEMTGVKPVSKMDWAIYCTDQLTGLIVACALIHPDKKLASITPEFVLKRMKEKSFAKGARREPILKVEEKLGIPLPEFVAIALTAMQEVHTEMGL